MNNLYQNIDELPVWNFDMVNKTGDFKYLSKDLNVKVTPDFENVWEKIFNEFIEEFGIDDNFRMVLKYQLEACKNRMNAYCNGKKHELTFANLNEIKAEQLMKGSDITLGKVAAHLSQKMGFRVNIREVSVREFYNYLKIENGKDN